MNGKDSPGVKETVLHDYKLLFSVYTQPHSIFCLPRSTSPSSGEGGGDTCKHRSPGYTKLL